MNNCSEFDKYGLLYQADEITAEEKVRFEQHYKECSFCRQEISLMADVINLLQSAPIHTPSKECEKSIRHTIRTSIRKQIIPFWEYLTWAGASAAAVLLLTFVRLVPPSTPINPDIIPSSGTVVDNSIEWKNGIDKEISRLKYEMAYFDWKVKNSSQIDWPDPLKELEEDIKGLDNEIEKM